LRANGWAGQAQPNGGASRNRDTKNNLGLKKRRISPLPHRSAGQAPAGGRHGGQKFPFPRPLSLPAGRQAFLPALPLNLGREWALEKFF